MGRGGERVVWELRAVRAGHKRTRGKSLLSVIAFHEKAGRSQVGSFRWTRFFSRRSATVATLPSAVLVSGFVSVRCKLGVLVSAGAAT
jgi:hypothetical protein